MNLHFKNGLRDGIPIALGYLSVSFGFGILAVGLGLTPAEAVAISASNLTSAGQVAGVDIIAAGGTCLEMVITQLIINIRYSLMGLSLAQKLDKSFHTPQRLLVSYGITDEDFESKTPNMGGLIVGDYNDKPSNYRYTRTLSDVMSEYGLPGITGLDTRAITLMLRDEGEEKTFRYIKNEVLQGKPFPWEQEN